MLSDVGWEGMMGSDCSGRPVFIFLIKENWICSITRHRAESNINVLLTRNLPVDSGVRHWRYSSMISLHYLCVERMVNLNVVWLGFVIFLISFVHRTVRLLFYSLLKRGGGGWKLDNFHGRHMCIVPYSMICIWQNNFAFRFNIC